MLRRLIEYFRERARLRRILKCCGCICYCPKCRNPLNDNNQCYHVDSEEAHYECARCSQRSAFNFVMAPCPIYTGLPEEQT